MSSVPKRAKRIRKWLVALVLTVAVVAASGCRTVQFYTQAVKGQYQIFAHEHEIEKLVADPKTPARLRERLQLILDLRAFAASDLKLPVDRHYRKYVDVHREFVVWNVEAASEFSLQPKTWWYPMLGSLKYRGYFSKPAAKEYGDWLHKKGYDVFVGGVQAYSTLGWFKDPVLNTFVFEPEADLAEILFHELGHQRVFARGDTDFNEAFATSVGEEGARRWLRSHRDTATLEKYEAELRRTRQFAHLIADTRQRLIVLYGDEPTPEGKIKATKKNRDVPPVTLRQEKQAILDRLQQDYRRLKAQWGGNTDYDAWFAHEVNNAQLNSVAAYYDLVPGFEQLLRLSGGDLEKFYNQVERLANMPKKERHEWLQALGKDS
jgi:predicted aminopeptidase